MWLARPVYESLPYVYAAAGSAAVIASWLIRLPVLPMLLLLLGAVGLLAGMVVGLRRWDYRRQQAQYNSRSLEDVENA